MSKMFPLPNAETSDPGLPLIVGRHEIILEDEQIPVLFTGINRDGHVVIGSSITEDYDARKIWYFHIIITEEARQRFIERGVTYRTLLEQADQIYIIECAVGDFSYDDRVSVFALPFADIPEDYRPLADSYCPQNT